MPPSRSERRYRCSACGRDSGLVAIAYGYMEGTLADDGLNLDDYSRGCESTDVCEDTIQCPDHWGAPIEKLIDGIWHRWESCSTCIAGQVRVNGRWGHQFRPCRECGGRGGHEVPIAGAVAA